MFSECRAGSEGGRQVPGSRALALDYFRCILLARASKGIEEGTPFLMGGAVKNTDVRKGETLGPFLPSTWKRLVANFTMEFRVLEGQGL